MAKTNTITEIVKGWVPKDESNEHTLAMADPGNMLDGMAWPARKDARKNGMGGPYKKVNITVTITVEDAS